MVQQYLKANLSQEVLTTGSCAIIDLPDNWNDYMSTLSKKWRDQIKRGRKELEQKGAIRTAVIQNENDLEDALKAFIVLHQKKWESQGGKGLFGSSKFLRFHQDVIKRLTAVGQVYFHQLYCADRLVATSYMLTYKDTRYFYLPAYDYSFEMKIGLGLIERSYDIERSTGEKIKFYDFYRAPEGSYKWHMAKEKKDIVSYLSANQTGKYFWYQTFRSTKRAAKRVIDLCRGKKN
jgi:CelD/BcsL family acetyltransferase involved in cellulose biosynthesis